MTRPSLRAGWGITYSALSNWWYVTGGSSTLGVGFNSLDWTNPAFGEAALRLRDGLQYNPADLYAASLDPGIRPSPGQLDVPPAWGAQINRSRTEAVRRASTSGTSACSANWSRT